MRAARRQQLSTAGGAGISHKLVDSPVGADGVAGGGASSTAAPAPVAEAPTISAAAATSIQSPAGGSDMSHGSLAAPPPTAATGMPSESAPGAVSKEAAADGVDTPVDDGGLGVGNNLMAPGGKTYSESKLRGGAAAGTRGSRTVPLENRWGHRALEPPHVMVDLPPSYR